ncbi:MAG: peptidoglycan-associated lipoprotein Pal [Alphaproteobacteria bacterium]|nr:MAG: peptidoglycan-associated lipoprotein Pal [Alphaproteobacteria bacterium]
MNIVTKYGAIFSCLFALAACETPSEADTTGVGNENTTPTTGDSVGSSTMQEAFNQQAGDRVFFALDSSVVTSEGRATLERQAQWLNQNPSVAAVVEGHCDERGTREYNLALGERRGNAARDVLVAAGVSPARLTVISYGKERAAVMGSDEQSWAQNRRAVTVLTAQ